MKKWVFSVAAGVVLAGLVGCATAPTIKTGWDKQVDFGKYHTWTWQPDGSIRDKVWAKRCQDVLSDTLDTKKLTQVSQNPDLWAVVHARLTSDTVVVPYSSTWGYGMAPWGYDDSFTAADPGGHHDPRPRGRQEEGGRLAGQGQRRDPVGHEQRGARAEPPEDPSRRCSPRIRRRPREPPHEPRGASRSDSSR